MIKLVIFDMAGTAINEDNVVYKTLTKSIKEGGVEVTLDEVLLHGAGKEKKQAIQDVLESKKVTDDALVEKIHTAFRSHLKTAYNDLPLEVFPSVDQFITEARRKGVKIAFNTGYKRKMADYILYRVGYEVGNHIDMLVASDDVSKGRPHPDMILKICDELEVSLQNTIKIGDSGIDISEGQHAGVALSIGVTTGAQKRVEIEEYNPDYVIDDASELWAIMNEYA